MFQYFTDPPKAHLTYNNEYVGVNLGSDITLTCFAEGFPMPTIQWLLDGKPADNKTFPNFYFSISNTTQTARSNEVTSTLQWFDVLYIDFGKLTCAAGNDAGTSSATDEIEFQKVGKFIIL